MRCFAARVSQSSPPRWSRRRWRLAERRAFRGSSGVQGPIAVTYRPVCYRRPTTLVVHDRSSVSAWRKRAPAERRKVRVQVTGSTAYSYCCLRTRRECWPCHLRRLLPPSLPLALSPELHAPQRRNAIARANARFVLIVFLVCMTVSLSSNPPLGVFCICRRVGNGSPVILPRWVDSLVTLPRSRTLDSSSSFQ
jgi:hypothetical protein